MSFLWKEALQDKPGNIHRNLGIINKPIYRKEMITK